MGRDRGGEEGKGMKGKKQDNDLGKRERKGRIEWERRTKPLQGKREV